MSGVFCFVGGLRRRRKLGVQFWCERPDMQQICTRGLLIGRVIDKMGRICMCHENSPLIDNQRMKKKTKKRGRASLICKQ